MKISREIWIDGRVKWNALRKRSLRQYNRYKGHAYIVCTSPSQALLFEIIEARWVGSYYNEATVLALCETKEQALERVKTLVDALFNQQNITYTQLKQE